MDAPGLGRALDDGSGVDTTELVVQAQHGDEGAFASLAVVIGNRLHPIAHRILRDADLADDATQQALLAIWRDLPQLRDPARFDGWAYRLLVRACYSEVKKTRRLAPNLRVCISTKPSLPMTSRPSLIATSWSVHSGGCRSTTARSSCCTTTWTFRSPRSPKRSRSRRHRSIPTLLRDACAARGARRRRASGGAGGSPMNSERDANRIVRSWLEAGWTGIPDRVLDSVLPSCPRRSSGDPGG